jgi:hypothetical protein
VQAVLDAGGVEGSALDSFTSDVPALQAMLTALQPQRYTHADFARHTVVLSRATDVTLLASGRAVGIYSIQGGAVGFVPSIGPPRAVDSAYSSPLFHQVMLYLQATRTFLAALHLCRPDKLGTLPLACRPDSVGHCLSKLCNSLELRQVGETCFLSCEVVTVALERGQLVLQTRAKRVILPASQAPTSDDVLRIQALPPEDMHDLRLAASALLALTGLHAKLGAFRARFVLQMQGGKWPVAPDGEEEEMAGENGLDAPWRGGASSAPGGQHGGGGARAGGPACGGGGLCERRGEGRGEGWATGAQQGSGRGGGNAL